jgi:hypothetical protein
MMFPGWGMGGWMMAGYGLVALLVLVAAVVVVFALSRRAGLNGSPATPRRRSCSLNAMPAGRSMTTSTSSG